MIGPRRHTAKQAAPADPAAGAEAARELRIANPYSNESVWLSPAIAAAAFKEIQESTGAAQQAAIAVLNAKSVLHAGAKQGQIADAIARNTDKTARRLVGTTIALVLATVILALTTIALPIIEHHFNKPDTTRVVVPTRVVVRPKVTVVGDNGRHRR